jgi:hypothetical protein
LPHHRQTSRLFVSNAVYAGCFFALQLANVIFLKQHRLARAYGISEAAFDPDFEMFNAWQRKYQYLNFWWVVRPNDRSLGPDDRSLGIRDHLMKGVLAWHPRGGL